MQADQQFLRNQQQNVKYLLFICKKLRFWILTTIFANSDLESIQSITSFSLNYMLENETSCIMNCI